MLKYLLIILAITSSLLADEKFLSRPNRPEEISFEAQMPDLAQVIKCIKEEARDLPQVLELFEKNYNDFQSKNYIAILADLTQLKDQALTIYNKCKDKSLKFTKIQLPDWNQIIQCIRTAVAELPDLQAKFELIFQDFQESNFLKVLMDVASLKDDALKLYHECKAQIAEKVFALVDMEKTIKCMESEDEHFRNNFTLPNGVGNCAKSAYAFCCGVGTPCDCNKGAISPGQCEVSAYTFCCMVGKKCDCSQPPLEREFTIYDFFSIASKIHETFELFNKCR